MPIYDLTINLTAKTPVFPGDPNFSIEHIKTIGHGGGYFNLCHLHLANHTGTHIDFPAHVIEGGKTSSDYPIAELSRFIH